MTARIYTIPARDVVKGMLYRFAIGADDAVIWKPIIDVEQYDDGIAISMTYSPRGYLHLYDGDLVEVALPGPSPRELLCSCCEGNGCGDSQEVHDHRTADWRTHRHDCPVYRLRLRLWPMGATWDGVSWVFDASSLSEWAIAPGCLVQTLRPRMVASESYARWLQDIRAAFCEPEVQP